MYYFYYNKSYILGSLSPDLESTGSLHSRPFRMLTPRTFRLRTQPPRCENRVMRRGHVSFSISVNNPHWVFAELWADRVCPSSASLCVSRLNIQPNPVFRLQLSSASNRLKPGRHQWEPPRWVQSTYRTMKDNTKPLFLPLNVWSSLLCCNIQPEHGMTTTLLIL